MSCWAGRPRRIAAVSGVLVAMAVLCAGCTAGQPHASSPAQPAVPVTTPTPTATAGSARAPAAQPSADGRPGPPLPAASFPSPLATVLALLVPSTHVGVEAPTALPAGLSATESGSGTTYQVNLFHCPVVYPVNARQITGPDCSSMAAIVGGFGGALAASPAAAVAALPARAGAPSGPACGGHATGHPVSLGTGIVASLWRASPPKATPGSPTVTCLLDWQEGRWRFEVFGLPSSAALEQVGAGLVGYLHTHLLPETAGVFAVDDAPDGQHTMAAWAWGATVYWAGDYHSAVAAARLAVAMRSVR